MITLGSLFSGSGGFEFAGSLVGIKPIWNAEIEKFPRAVTDARFPDVKQLGDVTQINGAEIEPVDIITFGSPCQDLSIAGKQAGIIDGSRSSLFFQAIRIIKEMRKATNNQYPKFAVWENVRGALSSNKGDDFYEVMQAFASVCEPEISIPRPKKWEKSGWMDGNGWSVAWRLYDAQYWGVPQRRKRIYLVADFASERAGEILFERKSVRRNFTEGGKAREGTAADVEGSIGRSCGVRCYALDSLSSNSMKSKNPYSGFHEEQIAKTLDTRPDPCCNQGGNVIVEPVYALQGNGIDRADTAGCNGCGWREGEMYTLNTIDRPAVAFQASGDRGNPSVSVSDRSYCLAANPMSDRGQAVCFQQNQRDEERELIAEKGTHPPRKYIVRRLTPLECCRLQGFPDWWEDGVDGSDSARYKMWGNGIALPCAVDVLGKIADALED